MRSLLLSLIMFFLACGDDSAGFNDGGVNDGGDSSAGDVGLSDAGGDDAGTDAGGDDSGSTLDGATMSDIGPTLDVGSAPDAGRDAGTDADTRTDAGMDAGRDAGVRDAGMDAGRDAGVSCHAYTFGQPAVEFQRVAALPALTGGVIPRGIYDAVEVRTTVLSGMYRGTWVFEDDTTLQTIEQLTRSGAPPPLTPRTQTYRTVGSSLQRRRTCTEPMDFDNQYQVRREGGRVFLDVGNAAVLFTFRLRS